MSISPQIGYAYSPKTTVFIGPTAGISVIEGGGNQTFQGLSVGFNYSNLRKLTINGTFGVQARQYDGDNTTGATNFMTPVFNFGVGYDLSQKTNVRLLFERNVQLSDIQRGLTYTSTSLSLGVSQSVFRRFDLGLTGSYQILEYQGDAPQGRTDDYIQLTSSIGYRFYRDLFNLSIYYRAQQRTSSVEQFSYNGNSYGFQLTYSF
jgi:hypothetical protein